MIIRFFKSSYPLQYAALLLVGLVLWIPSFWQNFDNQILNSSMLEPGYLLLLNILTPGSTIGIFIAFIVTMASALLLNFVLERHDLTARNSLLPAFIFILFTSIQPELHWMHSTMLPILLLFFLINSVLEMYNVEEEYSLVFYAGVLIALSSLFNFPTLFFVFFVFLSFFVFRIYSWREWIILFLGIINVYFLLWVYLFWNDKLDEAFAAYSWFFSESLFFSISVPYNFLNILLISAILLLSIWSLFKILASYGDNILILRKKITVILWFAFTTVLFIIISGNSDNSFQFLLIAALAALSSVGLARVKKYFWMEIILGIVFLISLINNYLNLLS